MQVGSTDNSIEKLNEDLFEISQYVKGLANFIRSCITPMTISIQGDWGSGKTSMMSMVKETLGDSIVPVWFNTWQYSQFNMGSDLTISLLSRLLKELKVDEENKDSKLNETFRIAYKAIKKAGVIAVDHFVGGAMAGELEQLAEKFANGEDDVADAINDLKKEFQERVDAKIKESGKDRIVVFIDDLDRLNPGKAVELLEVLKVFLDCKNCVFVLAIDYAVVSQGVKDKYGDLIGEDKGKSFFDKIIQVPFKMPVAHYKVDKFIVQMFRQVNIDLSADGSANEYVGLIQASVGCNPRTMKRLFNAYLLLDYISQNVEVSAYLRDTKNGSWYKKMLFALLCCQHAYEELYNFMVSNYEEFEGSDLLQRMCKVESYRKQRSEIGDGEDTETEGSDKLVEAFKNVPDERLSKIAHYMQYFFAIIDRDHNKEIEAEEIKGFEALLNLTTITAAGNGTLSEAASDEKLYRKLTRQIMTAANKVISDKAKSINGENIVNPVYQCNTTEESKYYPGGYYMSYWADSWLYLIIPEKGKIDFETVMMCDIETGNIDLMVFFRRCKDFLKSEFEKYCSDHILIKEECFRYSSDKRRVFRIYDNIGKMTEDPEEQEKIAEKITDIVVPLLDKLQG